MHKDYILVILDVVGNIIRISATKICSSAPRDYCRVISMPRTCDNEMSKNTILVSARRSWNNDMNVKVSCPCFSVFRYDMNICIYERRSRQTY